MNQVYNCKMKFGCFSFSLGQSAFDANEISSKKSMHDGAYKSLECAVRHWVFLLKLVF